MSEGPPPELGQYAKAERLKGKGAEALDLLYQLETNPSLFESDERRLRLREVREQMADKLKQAGSWQRMEKRINDTLTKSEFPIESDYGARDALAGQAMKMVEGEFAGLRFRSGVDWKLPDDVQDSEFPIQTLDDYKPLLFYYVEMASLRLMTEVQVAQGMTVGPDVLDAVKPAPWEWRGMTDEQKARARREGAEPVEGGAPLRDKAGGLPEKESGETITSLEKYIADKLHGWTLSANIPEGAIEEFKPTGALYEKKEELFRMLEARVAGVGLSEEERKKFEEEKLLYVVVYKVAEDLVTSTRKGAKLDEALPWGFVKNLGEQDKLVKSSAMIEAARLYSDLMNLDQNLRIVRERDDKGNPVVRDGRNQPTVNGVVIDEGKVVLQDIKSVLKRNKVPDGVVAKYFGRQDKKGVPLLDKVWGETADDPLNVMVRDIVRDYIALGVRVDGAVGATGIGLNGNDEVLLSSGAMVKGKKLFLDGMSPDLAADVAYAQFLRNFGLLSMATTPDAVAVVNSEGKEIKRTHSQTSADQARLLKPVELLVERMVYSDKFEPGERGVENRLRNILLGLRRSYPGNKETDRPKIIEWVRRITPDFHGESMGFRTKGVSVKRIGRDGSEVDEERSIYDTVVRGDDFTNRTLDTGPTYPNLNGWTVSLYDAVFNKGFEVSGKGEDAKSVAKALADIGQVYMNAGPRLFLGDRQIAKFVGLDYDPVWVERQAYRTLLLSMPGFDIEHFIKTGEVRSKLSKDVLLDVTIASFKAGSEPLAFGPLGGAWPDWPGKDPGESEEDYKTRLIARKDAVLSQLRTVPPGANALGRVSLARMAFIGLASGEFASDRVNEAFNIRLNGGQFGGDYELLKRAEIENAVREAEAIKARIIFRQLERYVSERGVELPVSVVDLSQSLELPKPAITAELLKGDSWGKPNSELARNLQIRFDALKSGEVWGNTSGWGEEEWQVALDKFMYVNLAAGVGFDPDGTSALDYDQMLGLVTILSDARVFKVKTPGGQLVPLRMPVFASGVANGVPVSSIVMAADKLLANARDLLPYPVRSDLVQRMRTLVGWKNWIVNVAIGNSFEAEAMAEGLLTWEALKVRPTFGKGLALYYRRSVVDPKKTIAQIREEQAERLRKRRLVYF